MNGPPLQLPPNSEQRWSSAQERVIVQLIHWTVIVLIVVGAIVLNATDHLSDASTTAILGTALGHAGTSAGTKLSARSQQGG